jgi:hypothetical protein
MPKRFCNECETSEFPFRQPHLALRVAASPEARMIAAPYFRTVKKWGPYCGDCSIFLRLEELDAVMGLAPSERWWL